MPVEEEVEDVRVIALVGSAEGEHGSQYEYAELGNGLLRKCLQVGDEGRLLGMRQSSLIECAEGLAMGLARSLVDWPVVALWAETRSASVWGSAIQQYSKEREEARGSSERRGGLAWCSALQLQQDASAEVHSRRAVRTSRIENKLSI